MKQQYTLDEVHRYQQEIRTTEQEFRDAAKRGEVDLMEQLQPQIHVMREVLLRMHESLLKHGPMRPGWLTRLFTVREKTTTSGSTPKVDDKQLRKLIEETPARKIR